MREDSPILARLLRLHPKLIDLSLGRMERLLGALGNPERSLPPVIHVAGTNGKGSVVAYLRAALEAAGLRVHVYTSPHLVRFNERIRVAGDEIGDAALTALIKECEAANAERPITFFEITTVVAFLAFARTPADVVLLEVGLGGRLDSTNVIERPTVTVVTPVGLDHQGFLGDTLAAIAGEKAGIAKPGVPLVLGPQRPEAAAVLEARAASVGAPLFRSGREWRMRRTAGGFTYDGTRGSLDLPAPALAGPHQFDNAGTAVAVLEAFTAATGIDVPADAIRRGLRAVEWPARMQHLRHGPLAAALPAGWELWLDGGHNPDAGTALAAAADTAWADRPLHLVVGMLETKDNAGFLRPLAPRAGQVRTVTIPDTPASVPAERLAGIARGVGLDAAPAADVGAALAEIAATVGAGPARVLICGSLYLAGAVLALCDQPGGAAIATPNSRDAASSQPQNDSA